MHASSTDKAQAQNPSSSDRNHGAVSSPPEQRSSSRSTSASSPPPINIEVLQAQSVSDALLSQCAALFSDHYGLWGEKGLQPDVHVKMGPARLKKQCLFNKDCSVVLGRMQTGELVGHAFVCRFPWGNGFAAWVAQFVVRQKKDIKALLHVCARVRLTRTTSLQGLCRRIRMLFGL